MSPRRAPARTPARRQRVWAREVDSLAISAGGANQFDLLTDFKFVNGGASPIGSTVGRIRLTAAFDRTSTAADLDALAIGVLVAHAGDDAADYLPLTGNLHADWMFWTKRFISEENKGSGSGPFWEFDIKAMRKLDEVGLTLMLVVEAQALLAGTLGFGCSTLLLLP